MGSGRRPSNSLRAPQRVIHPTGRTRPAGLRRRGQRVPNERVSTIGPICVIDVERGTANNDQSHEIGKDHRTNAKSRVPQATRIGDPGFCSVLQCAGVTQLDVARGACSSKRCDGVDWDKRTIRFWVTKGPGASRRRSLLCGLSAKIFALRLTGSRTSRAEIKQTGAPAKPARSRW
jgi:hypothetical protein